MGSGTTCLKCIIITCNVILATIGLVMLAGGIFLKVGSSAYINQFTKNYVNKTTEQQQSNDNNATTTTRSSSSAAIADYSNLIDPFSILLIILGSVIAIVGLLGAFGVCCNSKVLLGIYSTIIIALVIAEIVLTILFFTQVFDDQIRSKALYTLTNDYVDYNDLGAYSLAWNYVMIKESCCGLDGYEDFYESKKWSRNRTVVVDGVNVTIELTTPIACCKITTTDHRILNDTCAQYPTNVTSNWQTGCWGKVSSILEPYRIMAIGIISAIIIAQALLALLAILISCRLKKPYEFV